LGTDPRNSRSFPDLLEDSDRDGLTNEMEFELGTYPTDPETDNDYLSDGQKIRSGVRNPNMKDTANDGLIDFEELFKKNPLFGTRTLMMGG
jgi:hypothetical protein